MSCTWPSSFVNSQDPGQQLPNSHRYLPFASIRGGSPGLSTAVAGANTTIRRRPVELRCLTSAPPSGSVKTLTCAALSTCGGKKASSCRQHQFLVERHQIEWKVDITYEPYEQY